MANHWYLGCCYTYSTGTTSTSEAIVEYILIHLHHGRAVLGRFRIRPCIHQDIIHNSLTCFSSCKINFLSTCAQRGVSREYVKTWTGAASCGPFNSKCQNRHSSWSSGGAKEWDKILKRKKEEKKNEQNKKETNLAFVIASTAAAQTESSWVGSCRHTDRRRPRRCPSKSRPFAFPCCYRPRPATAASCAPWVSAR